MEGNANQIIASLDEQIKLCSELLLCLSNEEALLRQNKTSELQKIVDEKASLVAEIEKATSAFQVISCNFLGIESYTNEALLSSPKLNNNDRMQIENKFEELKQLSKDCQFKNEVNGKVIFINQQVNQQLINALRGVDNNANVYNASGKMDN